MVSLFRLGLMDSVSWSRETCRCEHTRARHVVGVANACAAEDWVCTGLGVARRQGGSGEPPKGGETVSEGPEQGEVCVGNGPPYGEASIGHRPAVRGDKG